MLKTIYINTESYKKKYTKTERKAKGQFFTSAATAKYMAEMVQPRTRASILDAGAGNGMLAAAVVKNLCDTGCQDIKLSLYETDQIIMPLLNQNISLIGQYCEDKDVQFKYDIINKNFLTASVPGSFDIVVSNPPYKKISKNSEESRAMSSYVHGQPNLYGLFMCKAVEILNKNGDFLFITPRSWTSGDYFGRVRECLVENIAFKHFHLFDSRDNSFNSEDVLQETLIVHGIKNAVHDTDITVTTSESDRFSDINHFQVPYDLCVSRSVNHCIRIPTGTTEIRELQSMSRYSDTLSSLGYRFKTGPVVEFRSKESLRFNETDDGIPMVRSQHIKNGRFVFPDRTIDKPQYFVPTKESLRLKNRITVLLKRVTTKEDPRRIQACVYTPERFQEEYITVENHVNYLVKENGENLTEDEAIRICRILNSESTDAYFRALNGSTQINASEINELPISMEAL